MIGIVGKKCGMTRVFTDDGRSVPVTIVQANPNFINKIKTKNTDGYDAIQVTTGQKIKKLSKPNQGQINSTKKEHSSKLHEFRMQPTVIHYHTELQDRLVRTKHLVVFLKVKKCQGTWVMLRGQSKILRWLRLIVKEI
jgi:ribosomal protein L3